MKKIALAALLFAVPAFAAEPAPAPSAAPSTVPVQMGLQDVQVAIIAIANAGQACDQGVKAYCQLTGARDATMAKLQAAISQLSAPQTPAKKP